VGQLTGQSVALAKAVRKIQPFFSSCFFIKLRRR
jgi:hypothetical protein